MTIDNKNLEAATAREPNEHGASTESTRTDCDKGTDRFVERTGGQLERFVVNDQVFECHAIRNRAEASERGVERVVAERDRYDACAGADGLPMSRQFTSRIVALYEPEALQEACWGEFAVRGERR